MNEEPGGLPLLFLCDGRSLRAAALASQKRRPRSIGVDRGLHFHIVRRTLPRTRRTEECPMKLYRKRRRPSSRPLLSAAQVRALHSAGYTGSAPLTDEERAALRGRFRCNAKGGVRR